MEERKAELIRKMIELKRRELEELCAESHMPVPPLPGVDAPVEVRGQAAISAQVCIRKAPSNKILSTTPPK